MPALAAPQPFPAPYARPTVGSRLADAHPPSQKRRDKEVRPSLSVGTHFVDARKRVPPSPLARTLWGCCKTSLRGSNSPFLLFMLKSYLFEAYPGRKDRLFYNSIGPTIPFLRHSV